MAERNGCHPKEIGSAPLACPEQSRRVRVFAGFERRARFSTRADFILKLISEQTVGNISFQGENHVIGTPGKGSVAKQLKNTLLNIQQEKIEDPFGWVTPISIL